MTQDELKDKLKKQHDYWTNLVHYTKPEFYENTVDQRNGWSALLAVVELHKPFETTPPWEYVKYMACDACESWTNDGAYYLPYPCPTIQAIEKELK